MTSETRWGTKGMCWFPFGQARHLPRQALDDNLYYSFDLENYARFGHEQDDEFIFYMLEPQDYPAPFGYFYLDSDYFLPFTITEIMEDFAILVTEEHARTGYANMRQATVVKPVFFFHEHEETNVRTREAST